VKDFGILHPRIKYLFRRSFDETSRLAGENRFPTRRKIRDAGEIRISGRAKRGGAFGATASLETM